LASNDPNEQAANQAYAAGWADRLSRSRTDCLAAESGVRA
jgi:hypothetical protein